MNKEKRGHAHMTTCCVGVSVGVNVGYDAMASGYDGSQCALCEVAASRNRGHSISDVQRARLSNDGRK